MSNGAILVTVSLAELDVDLRCFGWWYRYSTSTGQTRSANTSDYVVSGLAVTADLQKTYTPAGRGNAELRESNIRQDARERYQRRLTAPVVRLWVVAHLWVVARLWVEATHQDCGKVMSGIMYESDIEGDLRRLRVRRRGDIGSVRFIRYLQ